MVDRCDIMSTDQRLVEIYCRSDFRLVSEISAITSDDARAVSVQGFRSGLKVWVRRPHVLNRRLCAVNPLAKIVLSEIDNGSSVFERDRRNRLVADLVKVREKCASALLVDDEEASVMFVIAQVTELLSTGKYGLVVDREEDVCGAVSIEIRELVPKQCGGRRGQQRQKLVEILVADEVRCLAVFLPLSSSDGDSSFSSSNHIYGFRFVEESSTIQLLVWNDDQIGPNISPDIEWIGAKVLPKIVQWAKEYDVDCCTDNSVSPNRMLPSLSLISAVEYASMYHELKAKYGRHLVEIWPESTDPSKFVYEDIAIASYLMVLWNAERESFRLSEKQSFVDLGCGNGLLTHILSSEGHRGVGVDIQRRKIWDLYGPQTKLFEGSITPSSDSLFPEFDWIIGNHSDELTPWIPVIAARSSRSMKFFLLPCCAHNFDSKFQRRNSRLSQYGDYLEFVSEIGRVCGFKVERDKMRIPSTKRICLIGKTRLYESTEWSDVDSKITDFVESQSRRARTPVESEPNDDMDCGNGQWAVNFRTREAVQVTRNCTAIENSVKEHIVRLVFDAVLSNSTNNGFIDTESGRWRKGGSVHLSELADRIEPAMLQKMKNECGGLQTLLRNHYYIFHVVQGMVTLRNYVDGDPLPRRKKNVKSSSAKLKQKLCWFHSNHPDGCPISTVKCKFIHSTAVPTHVNNT